MLTIDGSMGEGGGQVLRTSLALSLVTGVAFRIENIRAGRKKPGLMRQHLTAVQAAATIGQATVTGAAIGSTLLEFRPKAVQSGAYEFAVGTAGSATLVLQTVLPALLLADSDSRLTLQGATHNPHAPPFDFIQKTFLPLVNRMGPQVEAQLSGYGFHPAGGGRFTIDITPCRKLTGIELPDRGTTTSRRAVAIVSNLPIDIAHRELNVCRQNLNWDDASMECLEVSSPGPGNVLLLELHSEHLTEVFTRFGERGIRAESVARSAVEAVQKYLAADVPVGSYLADQLMLPLAIAGAGSFTTLPLSRHSETNIDVIQSFLSCTFDVQKLNKRQTLVSIRG